MPCPDSNSLKAYLVGALDDSEGRVIDQHIASCDACTLSLSQLESAHDSMEQSVRHVVQTDSHNANELDADTLRLISALKSTSKRRRNGGNRDHGGNSGSPMLDANLPFTVGDCVSNYRLVGVLGCGGMGVVYEAEDEQLHRRVAIKVIRPELARHEMFRERFLREARAVAALTHDHIMPIYHVGQCDDTLFMVMPQLQGESLADRLTRQHKLSVDETLRIGWQVAEGLAYAHESNLVHRDLKPANIWVEDVPDAVNGGTMVRARILDFGLVARPASQLTAPGTVVGTPGYLAPEQVRCTTDVDPRCDLFSLGVILFECLSGQRPFRSSDWLQYLDEIVNNRPDITSLHAPRDLGELINALLARRPEDRPLSAQSVALAIQSIGDGDSKSTFNRRAASIIAVSVGAILLVTTIGVTIRGRFESTPTVTAAIPLAAAPEVSTTPAINNTSTEPQPGTSSLIASLKPLRERTFDDETNWSETTDTMNYGVRDGVYFTECDGSRMKAIWTVFRFAPLPKHFVAEVRMRLRHAEYGVWFGQLDDPLRRWHWTWWANIKGTGRWKLEEVVSPLDAAASPNMKPRITTIASGATDDAPWFPDDQWRTLRLERLDHYCRLSVDEQTITNVELSSELSPDAQPTKEGLLIMLQSNAPDQNPYLEIDCVQLWTPQRLASQ